MNSLICPSFKNEVTIVSIGSETEWVSESDIEMVHNWIEDHFSDWPACFENLKKEYNNLNLKIKVWPKIKKTNDKYIWYLTCKDFAISLDFKKIFRESGQYKKYTFITWGGIDIIRLNQKLIAFL